MRNINKLSAVLVIAVLVAAGCDNPNNVNQEKEPSQNLEEKAEALTERDGQPIDGQFIVVYKDDGKAKMAPSQVKKQTSSILGKYNIQRAAVKSQYNNSLKGFTAQLNEEQLANLKSDDRVDFVEQDRIVMLSPPRATASFWCIYFGINCEESGGDPQVTPYGITRVGGATNSSGTAWVIDTGVDLDHDDLNVDTQRSASFVTGETTADDGNGHGTHVAGTIAAIDNEIDVIGVAAGATVVGVKVLNSSGSGTTSGVIEGVEYVAQNASPGDVANLSLGGGTSTALDNAVANAASNGIHFALAAGNDSEDANNSSPARVNGANIYTISAIDSNDSFASFSNYGNPPVDYAAPGVDVKSLWMNNGTNTISGTSMASPHAAGVLLVTGGNPTADGTASSDPDGNPDAIIHN